MGQPSIMEPLSLNAAKNRRTGFLTGLRKRLANIKVIFDDPESLELDKLSTASDRLEEAWMKYENINLEVLGLILEDEVENEKATFNDMEENYEAAIDEARRIIKGRVAEVGYVAGRGKTEINPLFAEM